MNKKIHVSVRAMAEFILRSGDIDNRYARVLSPQEGTNAHKRLQRARAKEAESKGFGYEKEVRLDYTFERNGFLFTVDGRADGIIREPAGIDPDTGAAIDARVCIEEIKSTLRPLAMIEKNEAHWHWAQAKCYAFLVAAREGLASVRVRLTYMHIETEETRFFEIDWTRAEAEDFFMTLVNRYFEWAAMDYERKRTRDATVQSVAFPFEQYRQGQRSFAVAVYQTIRQCKKMFVQAPTGTGKTMSVLFPAVKAIGVGLADKIFYLTAKTITRQAAEEAAGLLGKKGAAILSVTLTAKEKICFCAAPRPKCNPMDCIYAHGHFDRVNAALWGLLKAGGTIRRQEIEDCAKKHTVCPYELSLDVTDWVDLLICDYNYVFDPKVQLRRFFAEAPKERFLFLVDEAHNLVDRSREMYSKALYEADFRRLQKELKPLDKALARAGRKIGRFLSDEKKERALTEKGAFAVAREVPTAFCRLLRGFTDATDLFLARAEAEPPEALLEQYFNALDFLSLSEGFDESTVVFSENGDVGFSVKLLCLDAAKMLDGTLKKSTASIFFSATLTPLTFFKDVLGGEADDYRIRMASPFKRDRLCLILAHTISTRYQSRAAGYGRVAACIQAMAGAKKGNYFVFFPSYAYLRPVYERFAALCPEMETLVQTPNMTEDDREQFLTRFTDDGTKTMVAFAVMGGIFSEGIDLAGERLSGAAVVGVGLPLLTPERDLIVDYYNRTQKTRMGFEYAYVYPGMNKVMQSAGRVIRTEEDRGVVLLIDDRFADARYLALFPPEWADYKKAAQADAISAALTDFWDKQKGDGLDETGRAKRTDGQTGGATADGGHKTG